MGSTELGRVKQWFTGWVHEYDSEAGYDSETNTMIHPYHAEETDLMDGVDHWANLMPEKLFKRAEALDVSEAVRNSAGALDEAYTIEFSGWGGLMEFRLTHDHMRQHMDLLGPSRDASENIKGEHELAGKYAQEAEGPGYYLKSNFFASWDSEGEESHTKTTTKEGNTEVSFVLGDEDRDDHFVSDLLGNDCNFFHQSNTSIALLGG